MCIFEKNIAMQPTISKIFIAFCLLFVFAGANCQTRVIRGTVTTFTDLPVGNLEVTAKKALSSVKTDANGNYTIVCNTKDVLIFKGVVFEEKKVKIKKDSEVVDVSMEFVQTPENVEIAVGYGYVSDADKLISAAKASSDNGFCNYSDIFDLIRAKFPGVTMNSGCVILRGISSVTSSSCALFVVNGQVMGSVSHIVPCDVKSIDIIKDSGAAIYGAQGANGVIMITTK